MKIIDVEGIGPRYADTLGKAGIKSTQRLLDRGGDRKGRKELAQATGISETLILEWVNRADLVRVRGVGEEYSDLLEQAGVDTIKELRNRNPEHLYNTIQDVNREKKLVRQMPSLKMVKGWVEQSKKIDPKVTY